MNSRWKNDVQVRVYCTVIFRSLTCIPTLPVLKEAVKWVCNVTDYRTTVFRRGVF